MSTDTKVAAGFPFDVNENLKRHNDVLSELKFRREKEVRVRH